MNNTYYTVEQISQLLTIHPKTIQRYIREGKLPAAKIGKGWRVSGHDLSVFAEANSQNDKSSIPATERVKASSVIDVTIMNREEAIRIMNTLTAAMNAKPPEYGKSSMHTQYLEQDATVRITLWGNLPFLSAVINDIHVLTEQTQG